MKTHGGALALPRPHATRWSFAGEEPLQWLCPAKHQWAAPGPRRCICKTPCTCFTWIHMHVVWGKASQMQQDSGSPAVMTPRTDPIRAKSALFEAVGPCVSVSETWAASPGFTAAQQSATEAGGFSLAVHKSENPHQSNRSRSVRHDSTQ